MAVELEDGGLMINARNYDQAGVRVGYRAVTYARFSTDAQISFDETFTDDHLQSPTVQASLHRYNWQDDANSGGRSRILFAIPDHARLRTNMTVRVSYDEGRT